MCIEDLESIPNHLTQKCEGFNIYNKFFSLGVWGRMDEWPGLKERPEESFIFLKANGMVRERLSLPEGWKERLFEATSRFTQET